MKLFPSTAFSCALTCALGTAAAMAAPASANSGSSYTEKTLHAFCQTDSCKGGGRPGGLIQDSSGALYGMAQGYGAQDGGVVFRLVPNADGSKWSEYILHVFCSQTNCGDGVSPQGELIIDNKRNLFGTTIGGGVHGNGNVFRLAHGANGWVMHTIHSFAGGHSGDEPYSGLSYAGQQQGIPWNDTDPLYGTTAFGGDYNKGVVYQLSLSGGAWHYQVIHSFKAAYSPALFPETPVLVASPGVLYGVTQTGAMNQGGELYELVLVHGLWKEILLHNFCAQPECADGDAGAGRPFIDASGNLFGATLAGGTNFSGFAGVIFEYTRAGNYQVIYNFCSQDNCQDGQSPNGGLIMDRTGNLFGTAWGEPTGFVPGNVFELTPNGSSWTETSLYTFCQRANCADGATPFAPLISDASGNLFGATQTQDLSGQVNSGTAFELAVSGAAKKAGVSATRDK